MSLRNYDLKLTQIKCNGQWNQIPLAIYFQFRLYNKNLRDKLKKIPLCRFKTFYIKKKFKTKPTSQVTTLLVVLYIFRFWPVIFEP